MEYQSYITLDNLRVYQLARELSKIGWVIYKKLDWQTKKIIGDQFITAIDSVGANIAEGYGRYHYLDRIKFYYNARASHKEAILHCRTLIKVSNEFAPGFNSFISSTYNAKNNNY